MLTQRRSLASQFAPCLLGLSTVLPTACSKAKVEQPNIPRSMAQVIDLNADVLPSLARLLESEEKLNQFMQSLDQLAEEDYQGLKSSLIKATRGNEMPNLDDVQKVFADLHLNTSEFNEELFKNLVRFCKEIEARPVLRAVYRDLDQARRDNLQDIAKTYFQTKDGQKLIAEFRKHGVNIQKQGEDQLGSILFWILGLGVPGAVIGLWAVRRNKMAESRKHPDGSRELTAIQVARAKKL